MSRRDRHGDPAHPDRRDETTRHTCPVAPSSWFAATVTSGMRWWQIPQGPAKRHRGDAALDVAGENMCRTLMADTTFHARTCARARRSC